MPNIRVLLVDDSPEFLRAVASYLAMRPGLKIVGQAASGLEAIHQVTLLRPDLVLMDMHMPNLNGLEATQWLKSQPTAPRVVVLSIHEDPRYVSVARKAGAEAFLGKAKIRSELLPMISQLFPPEPNQPSDPS